MHMSCTCLARREARCFPGGLKALPELFQSSGGQDAGLLSRLRANVPSLSLLLAFFSTFQVRKLGYSRSKPDPTGVGAPPPLPELKASPSELKTNRFLLSFLGFHFRAVGFRFRAVGSQFRAVGFQFRAVGSIPSGWFSTPREIKGS